MVAPDKLVERYGADTVRSYLMFFARWDQGGPWNSAGIEGTHRWLRRSWSLLLEPPEVAEPPSEETITALRRKVHQTLQSVTRDFERFQFNTVVSALMELLNEMTSAAQQGATASDAWGEARSIYLRMLAPVVPHVAEELWHRLGCEGSVHLQDWPEADSEAAAEEEVTLVVQVNGKVRDRLQVPAGISREEAERRALASEGARRFTGEGPPSRVIVVSSRLVNIVS